MSGGSDPHRHLPPAAFAAALAELPGTGPRRLRRVLAELEPEDAWRREGRNEAAASVTDTWRRYLAAGVRVDVLGKAGYPEALAGDTEPPAVLFSRGGHGALEHRRVAIVGTRRCTRYGREVAAELGRDLAEAGVAVVSGLALGIDGAAHTGALSAGAAPPVAVVGSGLDVVYPRAHSELWRRVGSEGLLVSEAPLGARPEAWRFPVRNRIVAALAEVVVVVESPPSGGSRHTVDAAGERGITVMAVPGSIRSPASELPNALLAEGCHPVRDATDVLVALGLSACRRVGQGDPRRSPTGDDAVVLDALGWEPTSLEELVERSGVGPVATSVALQHLESAGWASGAGGWWQRCQPGRTVIA